MKGYDFEREFVAALVDLAAHKEVRAAPLARAAWPHNKDAATKWRKIRNGSPPQELSLRDACDMAMTMGYSMAEVCALVQGRSLAKSLSEEAASATP